MIRVTIRAGAKFFRARLTPRQAERYDNGALISCGLAVGADGFTQRMLDGLVRKGQAREISEEEWKHSGCQSSCVRRGDALCQW